MKPSDYIRPKQVKREYANDPLLGRRRCPVCLVREGVDGKIVHTQAFWCEDYRVWVLQKYTGLDMSYPPDELLGPMDDVPYLGEKHPWIEFQMEVIIPLMKENQQATKNKIIKEREARSNSNSVIWHGGFYDESVGGSNTATISGGYISPVQNRVVQAERVYAAREAELRARKISTDRLSEVGLNRALQELWEAATKVKPKVGSDTALKDRPKVEG